MTSGHTKSWCPCFALLSTRSSAPSSRSTGISVRPAGHRLTTHSPVRSSACASSFLNYLAASSSGGRAPSRNQEWRNAPPHEADAHVVGAAPQRPSVRGPRANAHRTMEGNTGDATLGGRRARRGRAVVVDGARQSVNASFRGGKLYALEMSTTPGTDPGHGRDRAHRTRRRARSQICVQNGPSSAMLL